MARSAEAPDAGLVPKPRQTHPLTRAARGSALSLAGGATSAIASFGLTALVTRGLSATAAGVFFTTTSFFVLLTTICSLGTTSGLVRFIAAAKATNRREVVESYVRVALWPVALTSCAAAAALLVFSPAVASLISPDHRELATLSLRTLAWFVPFAGLQKVALSATRGLGTMRPDTFVDQLVRPGLQYILAAAIIAGGVPLTLSWSWGIPYGVAGILAWISWRRLLDAQNIHQIPAKVSTPFWRFSAPRSVVDVAQIAMQRLDIVLVGALAGAPAAALYTAATRFIVLGQVGRNATSRAIQPHLAAAMATGSYKAAGHLYKISTAWLILVSWPVYLFLLVDASPLLHLFGRNYGQAGGVLMALALAMLISTSCGHVDSMLVMSGRPGRSLVNVIFALVVNMGLDLWLIPSLGIKGAAVGWCAAIISKNLLALAQVTALFRIHPYGIATLVATVASVLSFGAIPAAAHAIAGNGPVGVGLGLSVAIVAYAALVWPLRKHVGLDTVLPGRRRLGARTRHHR